MDKHGGLSFKTLLMAFYKLMVLIIVAVAMYMFVAQFLRMNIDVFDVESEIFAYGVMHSQNGISYSEDKRVYPTMINLEEIDISKGFFFTENRYISAKFEFLDRTEKELKSPYYYNKDYFELWYPLSSYFNKGPGASQRKFKTYPVTYMKDDQVIPGMLRMTIVIPNS